MRALSLLIVCTALATFMGRLDTNIVSIALPAIAGVFGVGPDAVSNLMLAYLLAVSVLLIPLGYVGDRIGFRRLLLAGYAVFTLGSLLCGLAGSLPLLTAARAVQGSGAAMLLISAYSIIPRRLPLERVGRAMGAMSTAGSLGVLLGAPLGGVLTGWVTWRAIFLINLPVGALAIWLAWKGVPRDADGEERHDEPADFDWPGCVLGAAAVLLVILGVDSLSHGEGAARSAVLAIAGAACVAGFVWRQRHAPSPLISPSLFASARYRRGLAAQGLMFVAVAAHGFALPFYLSHVLGLSQQLAGLTLALFPVGVSVTAPFSGRLADRFAPAAVLFAGLAANTLATALFALAMHTGATWTVYAYLPVLGVCVGLFLSPSAKMLLAEVRHHSQGATTSMFHTVNNVSLTLGVAASALLLSRAAQATGASLPQSNLADPAAFVPLYGCLAGVCLVSAILAWSNLPRRGGG